MYECIGPLSPSPLIDVSTINRLYNAIKLFPCLNLNLLFQEPALHFGTVCLCLSFLINDKPFEDCPLL